jgi:hypothetical protein
MSANGDGAQEQERSMDKILLTVVGAAYLGLAIWCVANPEGTAKAVGFRLEGGSGKSEYLTVYGGLQLALGLLFLQVWFRPAKTSAMVELCLVVHACLVLARGFSLLTVPGIASLTKGLAAGEWAILIWSLVTWWRTRG